MSKKGNITRKPFARVPVAKKDNITRKSSRRGDSFTRPRKVAPTVAFRDWISKAVHIYTVSFYAVHGRASATERGGERAGKSYFRMFITRARDDFTIVAMSASN